MVYGSAGSTLTPLMEAGEARYRRLKVFSLPSVGEGRASSTAAQAHYPPTVRVGAARHHNQAAPRTPEASPWRFFRNRVAT